jgi:hypothetical protein
LSSNQFGLLIIPNQQEKKKDIMLAGVINPDYQRTVATP